MKVTSLIRLRRHRTAACSTGATPRRAVDGNDRRGLCLFAADPAVDTVGAGVTLILRATH